MQKTKILYIFLALAMILITSQNLLASETVLVEGAVLEISTRPNMVLVDAAEGPTAVYGIPFNYLGKQYDMVIEEGTYVSIEAVEKVHAQFGTALVAQTITVDGVTVPLTSKGNKKQSNAGTSALASEGTSLAGTVTEVSTRPNKIVIDDNGTSTEIYGIRLNYLLNQYNIEIEVGTYVSVEAYEVDCPRYGTKLVAYSITVNDVTVQLRPAP